MSEIETLSLLFDSAWYLATYQDVAMANCDPLEHYLSFGYREGRNPNRFFNTNFYLASYPDLAQSSINPFIHYILYGASEGRLPRAPGSMPLPPITFDIFLQEELIETEDSDTPENILETPEEPIKVQVEQEEVKEEIVIAPPVKAKTTTKKNPKAAPKAKTSSSAPKRKRTTTSLK
ncbi:Glycosyltransferase involved in cell wall bisynthesis (RfaB) (PDB:2IV7) [Commensalibacter communis]|uniref:hypothetical protein n=1 Tax=Commensalibacter communis TaxID=2972786 RepID=UPI0022FF857B|nr:hypothetical protein [Commensalibacter communis]CAI3943384.1 Glycosyltransferase involved in cell wall bisynthesis (RfaB) (PDB:2IV7) [Commensalibacter communis]CAI3944694.1 Glycosyltransferase involved in cell wall bisynthesis (RfaB) (PDB:2IV7) [Commensalibacter communis]